ncbi:MAG TPA: hypothetical protein VGH87_14735 [Polyangiaceae bacterium]
MPIANIIHIPSASFGDEFWGKIIAAASARTNTSTECETETAAIACARTVGSSWNAQSALNGRAAYVDHEA